MGETREAKRGRRGQGWSIVLGLLAWLASAAGLARAADLSLLAISSVSSLGTSGTGTSGSQLDIRHTLDLGYNREVTPAFGYRFRFLGSDDENRISTEAGRLRTANRFVEPRLDLMFHLPRLTLDVGGRVRETFTDSNQSPSFGQTDQFEYFRALYAPDRLPALSFQWERSAVQDDRSPRGQDQERQRLVAGITHALLDKLRLAYTFTNETTDDTVAGRNQVQRNHIGTANYSDTFFASRLTVDATYLINKLDTTERFSATTGAGGAALFPRILQGAARLTESTPTLAANNQVPAAAYTTETNATGTALTVNVPLVVNDGGTPNKNQSLAVGLPAGTTVSTLRLTVSPRAGDVRAISLQAAGITFQLFTGPTVDVRTVAINATAWTPAVILAVRPPSDTDLTPFFDIAFASTGGTLKVHVESDPQQVGAVQPLVVTQVEAFDTVAAAGAGRLTTSTLLQSVATGITARPFEMLFLTGNGTFSVNEQDPQGRRDESGTVSLTATGTPHRLLTATAVYQNSFNKSSDAQTPRSGQWNASLTLSSSPLSTLATALSGSRSETSVGGVTQTRQDSVNLNVALKPYRGLNLDLTGSATQGDNFTDGTQLRGFSAAVSANAILTPRLTGLSGYTIASNEVSGGLAPSSTVTNTGYLSLTYTVSRLLNANARWDFSSSSVGTHTVIQQYRLDVLPTPKTSVFLAYQRADQHGSAGAGATDSITLTARWNISRHLDYNVTGGFTHTAVGDNVYTVSTTLAFRL